MNDEPLISKYIDDMEGKWIGLDGWKEKYEPIGICEMTKLGCFPHGNTIFVHYLGCRDSRFKIKIRR